MCPRTSGVLRRALVGWARRLVPALLVAGALRAGAQPPATEPYSFAIVPQFEQRKIFETWRPILDAVSERAGVPLQLVATLGISDFERELAAGRFDFVYTNPYHVYRERRRQGYVPIVRDDVPLHGILVVPRASPIRTVEELSGRTLAVPSPNAIGASLLLRADLLRSHRVRVEVVNAKTHSSAYLHVVTGLAAAGGGVDKTLQEQPAEVRDALRVLYRTEGFASHPVAAHPRVPAEVRQRVQRAFLELAATREGAALLARVPMSRAVEARASDYDAFARLGLEEFWQAP